MFTVYIASDHAGYSLKQEIIKQNTQYLMADNGCSQCETSTDYPYYAHLVAKNVENNLSTFGILICYTGIGMSITANRHQKIRAALCYNQEAASLARKHNNANILCLGSKFIDIMNATKIINTFLETEFEKGRHLTRINKI